MPGKGNEHIKAACSMAYSLSQQLTGSALQVFEISSPDLAYPVIQCTVFRRMIHAPLMSYRGGAKKGEKVSKGAPIYHIHGAAAETLSTCFVSD
jgi:hypothetical protein